MPRIQVEPGQLSGFSGSQAELAMALDEARGRLEAACASASAAAGEPAAGAAIADAGAAWGLSLSALAACVAGAAANVGSAAEAYRMTDTHAMPLGGR